MIEWSIDCPEMITSHILSQLLRSRVKPTIIKSKRMTRGEGERKRESGKKYTCPFNDLKWIWTCDKNGRATLLFRIIAIDVSSDKKSV